MSAPNQARMADVEPTEIIIKNLVLTAKADKTILKDIDMVFRPGRVTVIVGPSGSGKTTLLSLIAGLKGSIPEKSKMSGQILMNNAEVSPEKIRKIVGFVFQEDVILETMTAKEAIELSIRLRVAGMDEAARKAMLKRMIEVSQLDSAKDVIIGSPLKKGISGGERKRTAIAMELVSNPSVLLLDEPSSGLDTYTAYRIMKLLQRLAYRYGRTVVATLHQPSSEIFHMIDDLYVLHEGSVVYGGPANELVDYFTGLGYEFPRYSNPLDVLFMDVLNDAKNDEFSKESEHDVEMAEGSSSQAGKVPLKELAAAYVASELYKRHVRGLIDNPEHTGGVTKAMQRFRAKWLLSLYHLFIRDQKNVYRNKLILRTRMFQTLFLAAFIAVVFWNTGSIKPPALFQNLSGVIFFIIINSFFATFHNVLPVFASEKSSFTRETAQGYYPTFSYFIAKISVQLPLVTIFPVITSVIVYWAVGLRSGVGPFLLFTLMLQLTSLGGFALGLFAASLFDDINVALAISILLLLPFLVYTGLFINLSTSPAWLSWIQYISPMRYSYSVAMESQVKNSNIPGGKEFYNNSGLSTGMSSLLNIIILSAWICVTILLSYLALIRVVYKNQGRKLVTLPKLSRNM